MKLLSYFVLVCALAGIGHAEMPACYKSVNRVVWLVQNVDLAKQGWIPLGLTDIHEYPDVVLTGQEHGKPVKMWAWEITGHLGNLTVEMIQPAEGQLNAWNDFLGKHGDGIFSIVHEVSSQAEMTKEISRMHALGVGVLQQLSLERDGKRVTYTYFDTEPQGKVVLGHGLLAWGCAAGWACGKNFPPRACCSRPGAGLCLLAEARLPRISNGACHSAPGLDLSRKTIVVCV